MIFFLHLFPVHAAWLSCNREWRFLFSWLNQPNQEAALLLKCKFSWLWTNATVAAQWTAVSLYSLQEVGDERAAHKLSPAFLCVLSHQGRCVCGCFDPCCCTFWLSLSDLEVVSGKSEWYRLGCCCCCCSSGGFFYLLIRQMRARGAERGGGGCRRRWWRWWWRSFARLLCLVPLGDQLVVFHQFFQSSIDCGLCVSEARALWRWLWNSADRKTLSHDSSVHGNTKHEAFVGDPCCF